MRGFSAGEIGYSALIALLLFFLLATRLRPPQVAILLAALAFALILAVLYLWKEYKAMPRRAPRPAPVDPKQSLKESEALVAEVGRLVREPSLAKNPSPEVREAVGRIYLALGKIVQAIRLDENKRGAAELVRLNYVVPTRDILRQYVKLSSRGVETARSELAATELELPAIEARLNKLFNYIHEEDIVNLSVLNDMVEESLLVEDVSSPSNTLPARE